MLGGKFFLNSKNNLGIEETESIVPSASLVSRSSLAVPLCTCSPENCSHRSRRGSYSRHSCQWYLQQWELDLVMCPSAENGQMHMVKAHYGYCCCITTVYTTGYLLLHNKLTQSKHLKTTNIYHLAVSVGQEPHGIADSFGSESLTKEQSNVQSYSRSSQGSTRLR